MGLYDREYTQEDFQSHRRYAPQMRFGLGGLTPAVKWLLIANGVVFLAQQIGADPFLSRWCTVWPRSWQENIQVWRLVTYQFLHGSPLHILFNMLGLFFLGPTLERHWGTARFVGFYLGCGIAGGLLYVLLAAIKVLGVAPMLGASGAILGMLAACAILFPHFVVIFILFPVPIRLAAVILIFLAVATIVGRGGNAGGEAAHLGGMAAGAAYVFSSAWIDRLMLHVRGFFRKRSTSKQWDLDREVDRILQKVHHSGIHSLTWREKAILKRATETEQRRQGRL